MTRRAVRVAAGLFVASAVLGIVFIGLNWSRHSLAWSTSLPALLVAALNVLIAVKLLQLRYWAFILARILTIWLAAGYIVSFATGQFAGDPPVVGFATSADAIITAALLVTLFLPSVSKAFRKPIPAESA